MEVDMPMNSRELDNCSGDVGKFGNLKAFVAAAREFETTHSESSVNLMARYLGVSKHLWNKQQYSSINVLTCFYVVSFPYTSCNLQLESIS